MLAEAVKNLKVPEAVISENFNQAKVTIVTVSALAEDITFKLFESLKSISNRDKFELFIELDGDLKTIKDCSNGSKNEIVDHFKNHISVTDVDIQLVVNKTKISSTISIYFIEQFFDYLCNESVINLLRTFTKALDEELKFEVYSNIERFGSSTISFFEKDSVSITRQNQKINRDETLKSLIENGILWNAELKLTPTDFQLANLSSDIKINRLFQKLSSILALAFLSNVSELNADDEFCYKVNGYKTIVSTIKNLSMLEDKSSVLLRIYDWVYSNGSNADKLGLVRNIFSIHLNEEGLIKIDEDAWSAILSNYQIYLIKNIQSYLEVKNKIGEILVESIAKTDSIFDGLLESLKQNFAVLITFILSVVVINGFKDTNIETIFSPQYIFILTVLIFFSYLWMKWISNEVQSRLTNSIVSIEFVLLSNYKKILLDTEINQLMEPLIKKQKLFINGKIQEYKKLLKKFLALLLAIFIFGNTIFSNEKLLVMTNNKLIEVKSSLFKLLATKKLTNEIESKPGVVKAKAN